MKSSRTSRRLVAIAAAALVALATLQPTAAGSQSDAHQGAARFATVAAITTQEFRVAVVAKRLNGGSTPTAEVRVGLARRVGGSWREFGEQRLRETYFWNTVSGPRAVCRLEINTAGTRSASRPHVTVRLLLSPSLGCGRTYRVPLQGSELRPRRQLRLGRLQHGDAHSQEHYGPAGRQLHSSRHSLGLIEGLRSAPCNCQPGKHTGEPEQQQRKEDEQRQDDRSASR